MFSGKVAEELNDLISDSAGFLQCLNEFAQRLGLDLSAHNADHIAVRCHQVATAERWKKGFLQHGVLFSEKTIGGRPVALFELHEPLQVGPWQIRMVELPWPGKKVYRHEGWEHVEIVLPGDETQLGVRALALLSDECLSKPGIAIKNSAPKGEGEKLPNPTLAVSDGRVTIKFHPWSLKAIVESELAP